MSNLQTTLKSWDVTHTRNVNSISVGGAARNFLDKAIYQILPIPVEVAETARQDQSNGTRLWRVLPCSRGEIVLSSESFLNFLLFFFFFLSVFPPCALSGRNSRKIDVAVVDIAQTIRWQRAIIKASRVRNYLAYFPGINFELRGGRTFLPFARRSAATPCRVARLFRKHENFSSPLTKRGETESEKGWRGWARRLKRNGVAPWPGIPHGFCIAHFSRLLKLQLFSPPPSRLNAYRTLASFTKCHTSASATHNPL